MFNHKILIPVIIFSLLPIVSNGQNEDNALSYSYQRPTGTARSIGLGGAMGALGGDYSAISINPAGIAVYRSSEFSFTPSLIYNNTESDYYGTSSSDDKFSFPINHISYVGTSKLMRETNGLVSTHFAIGYNRTNNYNRKSFIQGYNVQSSLLDEITYKSRGYTPSEESLNVLYPFYSAYLINPLPLLDGENYYSHNGLLIDNTQATASDQYYHGWEYIDWNNPSISSDTIFSVLYGIPEEIEKDGSKIPYGLRQTRAIEESGYQGEYNLTFGANIGNKLLLGASFSLATTYNRKEFIHIESNSEDYYYDDYLNFQQENSLKEFSYYDYQKTTGIGVNLNFGIIFKPIYNLRLGASIKTPTYYSMKMEHNMEVSPTFFNIEQESGIYHRKYSYNFRTPLNLTGSIAYIFKNKGLISFDYSYKDYSSMKFKPKGGNLDRNYIYTTEDFDEINETISNTFKPTHNFRIGAEYKVTELFALRGGYAYFQNPYKSEFLNSDGKHYNITGGMGFRAGNMTIDIAYLYNKETYIHSLYYSNELQADVQEPADMTSIDHQLAVTLGWRF